MNGDHIFELEGKHILDELSQGEYGYSIYKSMHLLVGFLCYSFKISLLPWVLQKGYNDSVDKRPRRQYRMISLCKSKAWVEDFWKQSMICNELEPYGREKISKSKK